MLSDEEKVVMLEENISSNKLFGMNTFDKMSDRDGYFLLSIIDDDYFPDWTMDKEAGSVDSYNLMCNTMLDVGNMKKINATVASRLLKSLKQYFNVGIEYMLPILEFKQFEIEFGYKEIQKDLELLWFNSETSDVWDERLDADGGELTHGASVTYYINTTYRFMKRGLEIDGVSIYFDNNLGIPVACVDDERFTAYRCKDDSEVQKFTNAVASTIGYSPINKTLYAEYLDLNKVDSDSFLMKLDLREESEPSWVEVTEEEVYNEIFVRNVNL